MLSVRIILHTTRKYVKVSACKLKLPFSSRASSENAKIGVYERAKTQSDRRAEAITKKGE